MFGDQNGKEKFCRFTGFPAENLIVVCDNQIHNNLEVSKGLDIGLGGWINMLLMLSGINSFKTIKDLSIDRTAFDRIISSGGFVSVDTGDAEEANSTTIDKSNADEAFLSAACIGCGACVAACKNSSAMLFTAAKVSQFALLPQGDPEQKERVQNMVATMDEEGFGACTNTGACSAECPKEISQENIARLNREFIKSQL